jgi:hypothetical protein
VAQAPVFLTYLLADHLRSTLPAIRESVNRVDWNSLASNFNSSLMFLHRAFNKDYTSVAVVSMNIFKGLNVRVDSN